MLPCTRLVLSKVPVFLDAELKMHVCFMVWQAGLAIQSFLLLPLVNTKLTTSCFKSVGHLVCRTALAAGSRVWGVCESVASAPVTTNLDVR
jgi:hypothetical protein